MNTEDAKALVDAWEKNMLLYLNGRLHAKAKAALVSMIVDKTAAETEAPRAASRGRRS